MELPELLASLVCIGLSYGALLFVNEWRRVNRVKKRTVDFPVLNLSGNDYAGAERAYTENLRGLLREGYQKYKHGFYQLFSPTGFLVIASADYVQEISQLPEGTLDFHGATQRVWKPNSTRKKCALIAMCDCLADDW